MLSIGKMGSGQERYYLEKVAEGTEDYYSGEGEAEGYWLGDGADDLGLQGRVEPDQLTAMLTGTNPASSEPLGLRHVEGGPVPGFDLTFSAPKSVSLLWALGGQGVAAEVKAAHAEAVDAALGYLQAEACWTRRGIDHAQEAEAKLVLIGDPAPARRDRGGRPLRGDRDQDRAGGAGRSDPPPPRA